MKKAIIIKYSQEFEVELKELRQAILADKNNHFNIQLLKAIEREKENLKINPHHGTQIPKKQIPEEYIERLGMTNLWKIDLPDFWRMLYTITGNELEIISVLLNFMDHDKYNKLFGYRKL